MKLSDLHSSSPSRTIAEAMEDPAKEEKLAYIQMMVARQGKTPDDIMTRIRGMIDPEYAKKEGHKKSLKRWLSSANPGDEKEGMTFERKVKITVLEAEVREMIIEGYFRGIGTMIVNKLKGILDKGRDESEYVTKFIDEYPNLASIQRYAKRAKGSIYNDEKFWDLVDGATDGKSQKIKSMMKHQFERDPSMAESGITEGRIRDPFSEITISEAKISKVMSSLGLDQDTIDGLMRQYKIRDEDYDLSRLKGGYESAVQAVKAGAETITSAPGKAKEVMSRAAGKAKEGAKAVIGDLTSGPMNAEKEQNIKNENDDLSDYVIKTAYALIKLDEVDANTPEEASRVLDQIGQSEETVEDGDSPEVIGPGALNTSWAGSREESDTQGYS